MNNNFLKRFTYIYLLLPIIIFIFGWIKLKFSILIVSILICIIIKKLKEKEKNEIIINRKHLIIIFSIILLICAWGGLGGFFFQSSDWNCRNAIFRDLINNKWPVYYEASNSALTYYIGIWMIPAIIGKIYLVLFGEIIAWKIGNIVLLIWCAIGITLSIIWIIKLLNTKSLKKILLILFIFLFFSGLDFIGTIETISYKTPAKDYVNENTLIEESSNTFDSNSINRYHLEWWARYFQYSSMITQIFWVFNQSIVPWLIVIVFISEKRVNNYLLLILTCIAYGPLPSVGLIPLMGVRGIKLLVEAIKNKKIKNFLKDIFSFENLSVLITLLPIFWFYYTNNSAIDSGNGGGGLRIVNEVLNISGIILLINFYFLEIGIYGLILFKDNKKNELFITSLILLMFIPLISIGFEHDFAMRASIPSIVVINFYFVKYIINECEKRKIKKLKDLFIGKKITIKLAFSIFVFCIGLVTPLVEMDRGIVAVKNNINIIADDIVTFSNEKSDGILNFVCVNPKKNSVFYKYIAK